nr:MAG TPA: hypothetical protein [Caudoviricetes sp.]
MRCIRRTLSPYRNKTLAPQRYAKFQYHQTFPPKS